MKRLQGRLIERQRTFDIAASQNYVVEHCSLLLNHKGFNGLFTIGYRISKAPSLKIPPDASTRIASSTGGVGLLPAYAQNFLPPSVTSRPLKGESPTVDLVLGYRKSNESPILKLLLSRLDELVERVSKKIR